MRAMRLTKTASPGVNFYTVAFTAAALLIGANWVVETFHPTAILGVAGLMTVGSAQLRKLK